MSSCIYHQFDDGQGLNGNVGPGIGFDNFNINGAVAIVAVPANAELGKNNIYYDKTTGLAIGTAVFDNSEPRMMKGGRFEQFPINLDDDGLGKRDPSRTQLPGVSLQAIGEIYNPNIPSIALSSIQVAAIRDTNPKFGLGDEVLVMSGGKMVPMKFFDYADDRKNTANNRLSHVEFNRTAFRSLGLRDPTSNDAPSAPVQVLAKPVVPGQQYFADKHPDLYKTSFVGLNNPSDKSHGR